MRALVTGGAGFIGSHLVDGLLADGLEVRVLDDLSTGHLENLPAHAGLRMIEGDVADFDRVRQAADGCDWIFHQAAIASVPRTIDDPVASQRVNYAGTVNVLEAARRAGTRRVMFAASAAAYGDLPDLPKSETMAVKPLSPYAVDKLASEYACRVYHRIHGLDTVCLRYFNVYGPRQDPSSPYSGVISRFADRLLGGEAPTIFGDGEQTRDFVYVADVVEANLRAATRDSVPGTVINVATGTAVSLNELYRQMCRIVGSDRAAEYGPPRAGDIRHSVADVSLAAKVLGWAPQTPLDDGLTALLDSLSGPRPNRG
jgi:UDP-glucose 4-epimerase